MRVNGGPGIPNTPQHHTATGFRNNYPSGWHRGSFWRWQQDRWKQGIPRPPKGGWQFPSLRPDLDWLSANRDIPSVTWIGHATFLLQLGGLNILTDPHLSARASPLNFAGPRRWMPPALAFHELPHIDLVVLSHNHYDHLDLASVRQLNRQPQGAPKFLVPLGVKGWFVRVGISNVLELDWWEVRGFGGSSATFSPAQHWSARTTWDRNQTLWGGWRLGHPSFSFHFVGDTGYSQDFKDIADRLGPVDLAAVPIGAYDPRWFMQASHMNPEEAVQVHLDLQARRSVAMHWGTFVLTDEPLDQPPLRLRQALHAHSLTEEDFWIFKHGETRRLWREYRG
ncbi:MAG: MBL fold metallo-hydrolase [Gammaproteobacteria bacterium]|nr:MBL fold metallo-hydrolase [Gammaproteobacteria bacterium]